MRRTPTNRETLMTFQNEDPSLVELFSQTTPDYDALIDRIRKKPNTQALEDAAGRAFGKAHAFVYCGTDDPFPFEALSRIGRSPGYFDMSGCHDVIDHPRFFRLGSRRGRPAAIVSHPYHPTKEQAQELAATHGLRFAFLTCPSWYLPNSAIPILWVNVFSYGEDSKCRPVRYVRYQDLRA